MSDKKWKVEYDNDTGPMDDYFVEFWTVTDGSRSFDANNRSDADWLCDILNGLGS